jgi:hypothetical protein
MCQGMRAHIGMMLAQRTVKVQVGAMQYLLVRLLGCYSLKGSGGVVCLPCACALTAHSTAHSTAQHTQRDTLSAAVGGSVVASTTPSTGVQISDMTAAGTATPAGRVFPSQPSSPSHIHIPSLPTSPDFPRNVHPPYKPTPPHNPHPLMAMPEGL